MKANEWLVSKGYKDKVTRGRMSAVNIAYLQEAYDSGTRFSDWPKVQTQTTQSKTTETVMTKRSTQDNGKVIAELPPYRFPETEYRAIEFRDGKRVERSMRSACNNCRASLVVCHCGSPVIVAHDGTGSVSILIERK